MVHYDGCEHRERVTVGGKDHNHGFVRVGPHYSLATVNYYRGKPMKVTSSIRNVVILKTTQVGGKRRCVCVCLGADERNGNGSLDLKVFCGTSTQRYPKPVNGVSVQN